MIRRIHLPSNLYIKPPTLIAHRGYALRYPENTMPALRAAIDAGARHVEFDVQLTADSVPVLLHDTDLWRTARIEKSVLDLTLEDVMRIEVNETDRLGPRFSGVQIPTLDEVVALLQERSSIRAFVELKRGSLRRFGDETVTRRVLETLEPIVSRCPIISFERSALERARAAGASAIGWVLEEWTDAAFADAKRLKPDYIFCDYRIIPDDGALWSGPWDWALYEVIEPDLALELAAFGARFIETMAIKEMLADRRLGGGRR